MFNETLKSIIKEVFTTKDMQDYLCDNVSELSDWQIVNIVRRAFIPLTRKKEMFEALAAYEDREVIELEIENARKSGDSYAEFYIKEDSYYYQAKFISSALEQLMITDKSEGMLLLVEYLWEDGIEQQVGAVPFYSYEKLKNYIDENLEVDDIDDLRDNHFFYCIEKYVENEEGAL